MRIINLLIFGMGLLLMQCNTDDVTYSQFESESFSVTFPSYMVEAKEKPEEAVVKYEFDTLFNTKDEVNFVIYLDSKNRKGIKDKSLDDYYQFVADDLLSNTLESGRLSSPVAKKINGLDALVFCIDGDYYHEGKKYAYHFKTAVIESPENFYELTTWVAKDSKAAYEADMDKIIESFKEK